MIELTISKRNTKLFRYSLDDGTITIGRNPDSEIYLNSPSVSHEHARISLSEGMCSIEDLGSKGGTLVNDEEIQYAQLCDNDVIQVGHYKIDCLFVSAKKPSNVASIHSARVEQPQDKTYSDHIDTSEQTHHPDEVTAQPLPGDGVDRAPDSIDKEQQPKLHDNEGNPFLNSHEDPNPQQSERGWKETQVCEDDAERPSSPLHNRSQPPAKGENVPPLHGTGIDVLTGPAQGKRIYFTRDSAVLGVKDVTAVVIRSVEDGYTAQAPNEALSVTLNGDAIDDNPVQLDSGDLIAFSNLSARFFVETSPD